MAASATLTPAPRASVCSCTAPLVRRSGTAAAVVATVEKAPVPAAFTPATRTWYLDPLSRPASVWRIQTPDRALFGLAICQSNSSLRRTLS